MLGDHLKDLRTRAGLTMSEVVEKLGIPRATGYLWESPRSRPEPESLQRLLDLYNASASDRLRAWELRAAGRDEAA